ncbi:GDYXXLXY domain-containing protein [Leptolyngbya iicbica]|uniref:Membrane-anchored protein n=2 Tax=Cyanophyceae TaxID=3028117 RepID=A0A4Q7E3X8_9CYAN|nr:GDYXXLXY domain-containing protein [Leptolyngbya sp. LK]RZM77406.1 membrane-anchored protein [Leptolyngbya sp. LK]
MMPPPSKSRWPQLGLWAIALPLLLQTLLIVAVPLQAAMATLMGTTVILRTVPVDPYDPFRGYYTTLRYDISQRGVLSTLDGWEAIQANLDPPDTPQLLRPGQSFYVVLADQTQVEAPSATIVGEPWTPIRVTRDRPRDLPPHQIALKGTYRGDRIVYGLERYYLPEAERLDLENRIREAQTGTEQPRFFVEVRIGPLGNAVPIALWLQGDRIEF